MSHFEQYKKFAMQSATYTRETTEKKLAEDIDWLIRDIQSIQHCKEEGNDISLVASELVSVLTGSLVTRIIERRTECQMLRQQEVLINSLIQASEEEEN